MEGFKLIELQELTEKIKKVCDHEFEHCFELLARLIACRSLSGQEEECAEVLMTFFKNLNIPCFRDARGSVLTVSIPGMAWDGSDAHEWVRDQLNRARDNGLKILAYNAHMDIVSADSNDGWTDDPFKAVRRAGKIFGRGSCDMKGALAAMAMSVALSHGFDKEFSREYVVLGCFCTEEEAGEGLAFKELCEEFRLRPDCVILGEPSKMQIARGQRGKLECLIETKGCCAHTSVPETGDNAAYKMARALLAIENLDAEERFRHGTSSENILKRTTIVATSLESWPKSKSFVPDRSITHVTARLSLGENLATLSEKLKKDENWPSDATVIPVVYQGKSYTGRGSNWQSEHPAWETKREHPFFERLKSACDSIFDEPVTDKIWPFSTDGVYSAGMAGIPTLGIGPGHEEMAHKADEWVSEIELRMALQLYSMLPFFKY